MFRGLIPVLILLAGCSGYHVVREGTDAGVRLAVSAFHNDTSEPFVAEIVSAAVRERLLAGGVNVVAYGVPRLSGRVVSVTDDILAYDGAGVAYQRRLVLTVLLDFESDEGSGWDGRRMVVAADYAVTGDATGNRDRKDRAVAEAAFALAESILLELPGGEESP
ncbi:MAG: LPS assembly lipoprotein LptE [Nitrospirota bacterium]|nr:LPS assembly lipoprotein LptE [Nitrospirota bacterium]